jgi:hypothetical protein
MYLTAVAALAKANGFILVGESLTGIISVRLLSPQVLRGQEVRLE